MTEIIGGTGDASIHPAWDDATRCGAGRKGWHQSAPWVIGGRHETEDITVTVTIIQPPSASGNPDTERPVVDVTVHLPRVDDDDTDDEDVPFFLAPDRAVVLGQALTTAGEMAARR